LTILSAALALLNSWYAGHDAPLLPDLIGLLEQAPEQVRAVTLDRGDLASYRRVVDVQRLSPLVHDHINLLGRYHFTDPDSLGNELRPLRDPRTADD